MRNYFIHDGQNELGPFNIVELKQYKIKDETPIWFEGLDEWTTADTVEELKTLFDKKNPPPLKKRIDTSESKKNNFYNSNEENIHGNLKKKSSYLKEIIIGGSVLLTVLLIIFTGKNSKSSNSEFSLPNIESTSLDTTIKGYDNSRSIQIESQQKQIDEQNKRIAEQEKKEKIRVKKEKQLIKDNRINEITNELVILYQNLEIEKENLNRATAFRLLRSSSERNQQINDAQNSIDFTKQRIAELEKELNKLQPEIIEG